MLKKKIMDRDVVEKIPYYGALKDNSHKNIELQ